MAKWGEGDPRWIVEERPDATNVNNWHWTEKNADNWSKSKIKELFTNHVIEAPSIGNVVIEEVEKCDGEARANNRKGKLIFFYEWEITLKWKGHVNGKETEVTGKIDIPNLSEEHDDMNDVDVDVSLTTKGTEATMLKEMLRKGEGSKQIRGLLGSYVSLTTKGTEATMLKEMLRKGEGSKQIRGLLGSYVSQLKNEYSSGLILPKKGSQEGQNGTINETGKTKINTANGNNCSKETVSGMKNLEIGKGGVKLDLAEINLEERMKCTGQELFNALTQRDMIQIFTGTEAKMKESAEVGESFEILGGNISGKFLELSPFTRIVEEWRLKSWPAGLTSTVTIAIKQTKEDTVLSISQKGVPAKEVESTRQGWQRYYLESMKRAFGYGASLF